MKNKFFALLAAAAALTAARAQAQQQEGFYVGAFGGANFVQTSKKHSHHHNDSHHHHEKRLKFDTGYAVGGFAGYQFCQGFRVEAEGSYRRNELKNFDFFIPLDESGENGYKEKFHGHLETWAVMANALYDFDLGCWGCNSWDITPYVGAGIGYARERLSISNRHSKHHDEDGHEHFRLKGKGTESGFAWQLIAGIAYEITPCTDLALEYRFFKGRENRLYNHTVGLTAKYHF